MYRDEILKTLKTHESELRKVGVDHIALFGSCAYQEERPESDIVDRAALKKRLKCAVEKEAIYAF